MKIFPIHISNFKIDGGAMFGVVPKVLWHRKYPADEQNLCTWALRSVLIETGDHLVLVDTGYGDKQSEKFFSHVHLHGGDGLIPAIKKAGYRAEQITDVLHTHLHADHCGGGVRKKTDGEGYALTFPNARYWISKTQWDWALNPNPREADAFLEENLKPIQESGKLHLVKEEGMLFPGVEIRLVHGHTPGQIIPLLHTGERSFVFAADLIPSVAHIPLLWNMAYEVDPLRSISEKESLLQEALEKEYLLIFQHDAAVECCNLEQTPKGIRAGETLSLADAIRN